MKRIVSQKTYSELGILSKEDKKKLQISEIVDFLLENQQLFNSYTLTGPLGDIDVVELDVLEIEELKDYYEFIIWRRQQQAKPSYSFEIKSTLVNK